MNIKQLATAATVSGVALLSICLSACDGTSQGSASKHSDQPTVGESRPGVESIPDPNVALSVAEAYAAIPHRRTSMDFSVSKVPEPDQGYLDIAFHLIDEAIRLRVAAYQSFSVSEGGDSRFISEMDRMIDFLRNLEPPSRLANYHQLLIQALTDQKAFFMEWQSQGRQFQYGTPDRLSSHPRVQSASSALKQAYEILMKEYPGESSNNQDAFFDYHCALDFL